MIGSALEGEFVVGVCALWFVLFVVQYAYYLENIYNKSGVSAIEVNSGSQKCAISPHLFRWKSDTFNQLWTGSSFLITYRERTQFDLVCISMFWMRLNGLTMHAFGASIGTIYLAIYLEVGRDRTTDRQNPNVQYKSGPQKKKPIPSIWHQETWPSSKLRIE